VWLAVRTTALHNAGKLNLIENATILLGQTVQVLHPLRFAGKETGLAGVWGNNGREQGG